VGDGVTVGLAQWAGSRVGAAIASRIVGAPIAVAAVAVSPLGGPALAQPPTTRVITVVPVGPNGQPINGYQEAPAQSNITAASDCTTPSPSAVADDIYYCSPSAAGADTCWPSTPGSLLCVDDPWDKRLHRVTYGGQLPPVQPAATTDPFALLLDDGTRCRLRNGGAWGGRDDGYVGVYGCGDASSNLAVLFLPSQGAGTCIDRSMPAWTVEVGQLGAPTAHFPPPQTRTVTTAWFAGDFMPG
jgi:hypothetical protein